MQENASTTRNRSPYLEALSASNGFIDISRLENDFASRLMKNLLAGASFQLEVEASFAVDELFQQLYFEERYYEKGEGTQAFGLGFPLVSAESPEGESVRAPVWLWELNIEPGVRHNEGWRISRHDLHGVYINPLLSQYLKEQLDYDPSGLLSATPPTEKQLLSMINTLARELQIELQVAQITPEGIPGSDESIDASSPPQLLMTGLLGNFPKVIADTSESDTGAGDEYTDLPTLPNISPVLLNPAQASAYRKLQRVGLLWVNGKDGAGKTRLGMHALMSAMSNGQHCLVVSRKTGALKQYQEYLIGAGLERLTYLLRNTPQDKALFMQIIKAAIQSKSGEDTIDKRAFEIQLERAERLHRKLEQSYHSTRKKVFKEHNWTDTVGLYLASIRMEGKELLGTQVNAADYEFTDEEYASLGLDIADCYSLYKKTDTLRSPLSKLNPGIFLRMSQEEAQDFVSEKLDTLIEKGKRLRRWYINRMDAYSTALTAHYEHYYQQFSGQLIALKDELAEQFSKYGPAFGKQNLRNLKFKGVFSAQSRERAEAQQSIMEGYERLKKRFEQNSYFDFSFPVHRSATDIDQINEGLSDFEAALQNWRLRQREAVQEETARLSRKTAHSRLKFNQQIEDLEDSLNGYTEQINESGLYHLPFRNKTLTIPKQQRFLEEIIEQLEESKSAMPGFPNFYNWQSNWLQLDAKSRRLINVLVKVMPKNWMAAFESWFLDNLLSKHYEAILPHKVEDIEALGNDMDKLSAGFIPYLLQEWNHRKEAAFRTLKKQNKKIFQELSQSSFSSEKDYRNAFTGGIEAIRASVPALLTTPDLLYTSLNQKQAFFDLVIVEEAEELSAAEVEFIRQLGKRCMFLGNSHPLSPVPAEQLVERLNGEEIMLREILGTFPAHLFAALQNREKGKAIRWEAGGTVLEELGGRYDEEKETNEEEALRIISLLNEIEKTPQRTYPAVGIVCFTKGQRNLISNYILGIKQRRSVGVEIIQQLERNGLMVLTLEELSGCQFDTVIVSSTYGIIDLQSNMTGHFHRLDTQEGVEQMQRLMSCSRHKLYLLNSIDPELLTELGAENRLSGTHLYALYIQFLGALQSQQVALLDHCLDQLSQMTPEYQPASYPIHFLEEVRHYLADYLGEKRIELNTAGLAPLMIHPEHPEGQAAGLLADGFFSQHLSTDFRWEYNQLKTLEHYQVQPSAMVSANWWRSSEQEARKMASWVIQQGGAFSTIAAVAAEEEE